MTIIFVELAFVNRFNEKRLCSRSGRGFLGDSPLTVPGTDPAGRRHRPIESAGVYPLPEAQLDRFLFKIIIQYPTISEEKKILMNNTTLKEFNAFNIKPVATQEQILKMQEHVKNDIFVSV